MRHRLSGRKLNRNSSHRQAMFRNMAASLFEHEEIRTTLPKAKELRRVAEPLITLAKTSSVANRRLAFSRLRNRKIVGKLFDDLGVRFKDRPGGYLRILKCGFRPGDKALMAVVQLVERESVLPQSAEEKPKLKKAAPAKEKKAKAEVAKKDDKKKLAAKKEAKKEAKKADKKEPAAKKNAAKKVAKKKTTAKKTAKKKTAKKKTKKR